MEEGIAVGVLSLIRWGLASVYCYLIFSAQCEAADKEKEMTTDAIRSSRIASVFKTLGYSAVFTLIAGAGGQVCDSYDTHGCTGYSDEYREAWGFARMVEFYIPAAGIALIAWWMAIKGYRIRQI